MDDDEDSLCIWTHVPDSILLEIFSYLNARDLLAGSVVCSEWYRLSRDDTLWRSLVQTTFNICGPLISNRLSWREEYKHLYYHTPVVLSETLRDHEDEVLHVSFSHNGQMFSTTSKDCTLRVWRVGYPTRLIHTENFKSSVSWDFTQFSCFNDIDTMLMVSSVKRTEYVDRRGYLAVLSVLHDFQLLKLVSMDPSQLFGTWVDSASFLGGSLEISFERFVTTVNVEAYEIDKSTEPFLLKGDTDSYVEEGGGMRLFTFHSETASLIKFLTVANVPHCDRFSNHTITRPVHANINNVLCQNCTSALSDCDRTSRDGLDSRGEYSCDCVVTNSIEKENSASERYEYTCNFKKVKFDTDQRNSIANELASVLNSTGDPVNGSSVLTPCHHKLAEASCSDASSSRTMIYVTGEFAIALHQIGFKNISTNFIDSISKENFVDSPLRIREEAYTIDFTGPSTQRSQKADKADHMIDMNGHVTGLSLSKDNRYLFVNCRRWVGKVDRSDSWDTPDLSSNIEIRVIDMTTFTEVGMCYKGHKAMSESSMCCFIFLDASDDFLASGSEDCKGYLWDRHYGQLLSTYDHGPGVVNAVGFNPVDQEYFVTVSDDQTIKVWRSRHKMNLLNRDPAIFMSVK